MGVRNVVKSLGFHYVEVRQQNFVLRNVQMDTELIVAELRWLKNRVYDAAQYLLTILVILKEESIVLMNVRTNRQLRKKLGFVDIVVNHLRLIHLPWIFVVLGSAELQDRILKYGRQEKRFFVNACNVARNFGRNHRILKSLVGNIVQKFVVMQQILSHLTNLTGTIFMLVLFGENSGKPYYIVTDTDAKYVISMVRGYTFTTRKLGEMVGKIKKTILLLFAILATKLYTTNNGLTLNLYKRSKGYFQRNLGGLFVFNYFAVRSSQRD